MHAFVFEAATALRWFLDAAPAGDSRVYPRVESVYERISILSNADRPSLPGTLANFDSRMNHAGLTSRRFAGSPHTFFLNDVHSRAVRLGPCFKPLPRALALSPTERESRRKKYFCKTGEYAPLDRISGQEVSSSPVGGEKCKMLISSAELEILTSHLFASFARAKLLAREINVIHNITIATIILRGRRRQRA